MPDFPGFTTSKGGTIQLLDGLETNPISKTYRKAVEACEPQLPDGVELPSPPSPPPIPKLDGFDLKVPAPKVPG